MLSSKHATNLFYFDLISLIFLFNEFYHFRRSFFIFVLFFFLKLLSVYVPLHINICFICCYGCRCFFFFLSLLASTTVLVTYHVITCIFCFCYFLCEKNINFTEIFRISKRKKKVVLAFNRPQKLTQ